MSSPAIEVSKLSKRFKQVVAVDDFSFAVDAGEVCGLLGPNGAGKTTTLRAMVGLVRPDKGETAILGKKMRPGHPVLGDVGALIERPGFVPYLTGTRNLRLYWEAGGGEWPPPGLGAALDVAGLGAAVNRKVKTYSQGMRQRLSIAQSLLAGPDVLILDEPTNGLDPQEMREVRRLLGDVAAGGATVLLSTHLLSEVEQVCTRAVVMDKGRLVTEGTVSSLMGAEGNVYVEVDDRDAAKRLLSALPGVVQLRDEGQGFSLKLDGVSRREIVAALVHGGVGVSTITSRHRLEDAFIGLLAEGER